MRRRLLRLWPALMHWFDVKPHEVGLFTLDELNELVRQVQKLPPVGWSLLGTPKKG